MSQLARLQARREALLRRCAVERGELARLLGQLRLRPATQGGAGAASGNLARHPLAALALLAGLALLGRTREVLSLLLFMRTAVSLAGRAGRLLRRLGHRRAARTP